jgi:outer membrane protein TolC
MKIIKLFLYPALLLSVFNGAIAQEVYDLSRCIQTGLERNFALQVMRNQEQITENNYTLGNAGMLPSVGATGQYGGTLNSTVGNLPGGGELTSDGIHNNSGSARIDLGMTIFRGFQVYNTHQKLGQEAGLGGLNTQMSVENLVARIVSEYYFYIQQMILKENLAYAVSLSRERVRIDEQRYLLGGASKLELLQSIVYLNADSSRYAHQNEVLRSSQIRLNELMASGDPGEEIVLKDTIIGIKDDLTYEELLAQTLTSNTSLQIAAVNKVISELDYKIIRSRSYPYLTISSGYGYSYAGYETGEFSSQHVRGMNYGLTLGVNIFDGFNRNREMSNARIEAGNSDIQYSEVEQTVKAELLTIHYAYENNLRLLRLEEKNLEVAHENLEIALERYKLGSLAGLELREVQKSLLDAEERLIYVRYQAKLAEISLLQIAGRIMEYL